MFSMDNPVITKTTMPFDGNFARRLGRLASSTLAIFLQDRGCIDVLEN